MPFNVDAKAGPDVARLAMDTRTEFEKLRTVGVVKVVSVQKSDLPTDGSKNMAIVSGTSNGTVPAFWDGSGWFFMDGTPLT